MSKFYELDRDNYLISEVEYVEYDPFGFPILYGKVIEGDEPKKEPALWDWESSEWRYPDEQPCVWRDGEWHWE